MDSRAGNLPAPKVGKRSRFFHIEIALKMTEFTIYQTYSAAENYSQVVAPRINLLEGLATEAIAAVPDLEAKTPSFAARFFSKSAKLLAISGVLMLLVYFAPTAATYAKDLIGKSIANFQLSGGEVSQLTSETEAGKPRSLPPFNPALPKTNRLIISSIGVNTDIEEATYDNYEEALKKGVWRVSNFGEPDLAGAPVILAAHRYGYLAWNNSFRHKSSFYNLPKVKVGDVVTIDWQQRQYTYGVYKVESGEAITDYSADVILYTCESLNGPERIFVYAKLIS